MPSPVRPTEEESALKWALDEYGSPRQLQYHTFWDYYDSIHPVAFATEKFKAAFFSTFKNYAENLCAPVVDALNDRLKIVSFSTNKAEIQKGTSPPTIPGTPPREKVTVEDEPGKAAWDIWERNDLELTSTEVHLESLLMGDGYVLVWPNDEMEATFWPQLAHECRVRYDPNNRKKILYGSKIWLDKITGHWRLNLYFPDRIAKYQSKQNNLRTMSFQPLAYRKVDQVPNPYGRVPLFHFPNKRQNRMGLSELSRSVVALQDGLNKSVIDMLVSMEFAAFKQRYVIGMEVEINEDTGEPVDANVKNYGVDRLMTIPDPEAKVGQFDSTDLQQFLKVQDKFWLSAARVTGTPLHYFYLTQGDFPSGEAIKSAEGRFIKKIGDRQVGYGNQWEDALLFAMQIDLVADADLEVHANWEPATPRSDAELADTAVKKKAIGVPRSQLLREQGYDEDQIDRFLQESDAEAMAKAQLMQKPEEDGLQPSRDTTRGRQGVPGAGAGGS